MARVCPLFSGSSGNCVYVGSGEHGILIDAGVSAKRIETSLLSKDINPSTISAVFVTHEHSDHVSGLRIFSKRYGAKIYASNGTMSQLIKSSYVTNENRLEIINGKSVCENGLYIKSFKTSHDSAESFGYVVTTPDDRKISVATDLGVLTEEVVNEICGSDMVIIESNHDVAMLSAGEYPYYLKRRILSKYGHLSNDACAAILPSLISSGTTRVILAHLSRDNNLPELAYQTAVSELSLYGMNVDDDYKLFVAPVENQGKVMVF